MADVTPRSVASTLAPHSLLARVTRLGRSALVGGAATLADMAALVALVELAHLSPRAANVPALAAGALVQFLGNRRFVFRSRGPLGRQARRFVLAEGATLVLNGLAFWALTALRVPYALARPVGTFLVFVLFSYPLWHRVFRERPAELPA